MSRRRSRRKKCPGATAPPPRARRRFPPPGPRPPPDVRPSDFGPPSASRSSQPADLALEQIPGRRAELALPALVEAAAELRPEGRDIGDVERHAARGQLRLELAVQVVGVSALQSDIFADVSL